MKRGDLVTIAVSGDYGKPRPALVVQSDVFREIPSVTVLRRTTDTRVGHPVRIAVTPAPENGLRALSFVMIDKAISVPRERIGQAIGRIDDAVMREVSQALAIFLDLDALLARNETRQPAHPNRYNRADAPPPLIQIKAPSPIPPQYSHWET